MLLDPADPIGHMKTDINLILYKLKLRDDARAQEETLPKLREWCKKESQYVIRSGGVKVILDSLRNFPSDAGVQAIACATLGTLAYNSLYYPESKELWVANKKFEISKFKFKIPRARTSELQGSFSAVSKPIVATKY